jgi:sugar lactone lactonase YvrE
MKMRNRIRLLVLAGAVLLGVASVRPAFGQGGVITTIAGGGPNNTTALLADLVQPGSVAVDPSGNIIVSAYAMNQVFRIDTLGNFSVLAGTGVRGFSGDNGPATSARLSTPWGVATDRFGNVFIVDTNNQRVRRVDATTGIITTVAGNGVYSFSGDGGLATSASLWDPQGIAVDANGNLFIADYGNCRVRRVDASAGIITTVAGNGGCGFGGDGGAATSAELSRIWSVALDGSGNLFIADTSNYRVRRVDAGTQIITTVAGGGPGLLGDGGPATSAWLNTVFGVIVDHTGNLFIPDAGDARIRRVDASTQIITTIGGNGNPGFSGDGGPATAATLNFPMSAALDSLNNLIIADTFNNRLRRLDVGAGKIVTVAGGGTGGDGSPAIHSILVQPYGISVDPSGNVFIADTLNERIRRIDASTGNITTIAGTGWQGSSGDGGPATSAAIFDPRGVVIDSLGNIYIGGANSTIRQVAPSGTVSSPFSFTQISTAGGVAVDGAGNVYVANSGVHQILRIDPNTDLTTVVAGNGNSGYTGDGGAATSATLSLPQGVAVDSAGNVFIADTDNNVVRRVDAKSGIIRTVAGNGASGFSGDGGPATSAALALPQRLAIDSLGNLYVADLLNNRVRRIDAATGVITTVAGTGAADFSGDGGQATSAALNNPGDVAIDDFGYLYIVDLLNNRVRRVSPPPNATLSATSLTFAKQALGATSAPQSVKLGNTGPQLLGISSIAISGTNAADFGLSHDCGSTLGATLSCTISVTFTPAASGSRSTTLVLTDTSSDGPQTIQLSGTGAVPTETVNLSPATLSFGIVLEGIASATQSVTLTNSGSSALNISKIAVVGADYSQTNTCGSSVAAAATCAITVSYTPSSSGSNQTRIDITDDGISSPQSIALSGSGTEFLLAPAAGSPTMQSVSAGNSAQYGLTLTPASGIRDTVTLSCSGAPATVTCSVQPSTQTFTSTTPVAVTVSVSTTARSGVWWIPSGPIFPPVTALRLGLLLSCLAVIFALVAWARLVFYGSWPALDRAKWCRTIALFTAACVVFAIGACGGGGSTPPPPTGTPAGSYSLVVTAKSASSVNPDQTVALTLNVQ